ncbi:MAG: hypothetical protein HFG54_15145 [Lachnospiraceae bacterium]|nr:hypothetical protein [Lachnospiraceae bacterium]
MGREFAGGRDILRKKKKNSKNQAHYRHPININVGMIIFAIIFIYMTFCVYAYVKKEKIQFYEVMEGDIVTDHGYTGIILRDESVQYTDRAGYIHYYVREGKRAAVGSRIYSIDETGSLASFLAEKNENNAILTSENLSEVKRQLSSFTMNYSDLGYDMVYSLQSTLDASVSEYVNFNTLESLDSMIGETGALFWQVQAPVSGVVSYSIDQYEGFNAAQITAEDFDRSGYTKEITKAGQRIAASDPVYKLVTSDNWSILFPISQDQIAEYEGKTSLHVIFNSRNLETNGAFSIITGADGNSYGKLDFNQYMVQFITDRYVSFEVETERTDGLKIPVTAVTTKDFYLIPLEYLAQSEDSRETGFLKESYSENGASTEFVPMTIYNSTEEYYYIEMGEKSSLKAGDFVVKPDSTERYQIVSSDSLQGVYNINKGYAVFKQIEILKSNEEYYTIRKGMSYGLSVYDHIVLDASTVYEGQLIYR